METKAQAEIWWKNLTPKQKNMYAKRSFNKEPKDINEKEIHVIYALLEKFFLLCINA